MSNVHGSDDATALVGMPELVVRGQRARTGAWASFLVATGELAPQVPQPELVQVAARRGDLELLLDAGQERGQLGREIALLVAVVLSCFQLLLLFHLHYR